MLWWLFALFINFNTLNDLGTWANRNPEKVSYWLENRIFYKDTKGYIDPEILFKQRACDCKGFAGMFLHILNQWDVKWDQAILVVTTEEKAHAVCIFWYRDQYCYFSQGGIHETGEVYIEKVAKHIYPDWIKWRLFKDELCKELITIHWRNNED